MMKFLLALMLFNDANSTLHAVYLVYGAQVSLCIHISTYLSIYIYLFIYLSVYLSIYLNTYTYIYIYICIYIHMIYVCIMYIYNVI